MESRYEPRSDQSRQGRKIATRLMNADENQKAAERCNQDLEKWTEGEDLGEFKEDPIDFKANPSCHARKETPCEDHLLLNSKRPFATSHSITDSEGHKWRVSLAKLPLAKLVLTWTGWPISGSCFSNTG